MRQKKEFISYETYAAKVIAVENTILHGVVSRTLPTPTHSSVKTVDIENLTVRVCLNVYTVYMYIHIVLIYICMYI